MTPLKIMAKDSALTVQAVKLRHRVAGESFEGVAHIGPGRAVLEAAGMSLGRAPLAILEEVVKGLLVKKGADWTGTILSEYLELYTESRGTFCLVSDRNTGQLVAHAVVFQSSAHPGAGLLAHVRTADGWGGYGLGTLVTEEVTRSAFQQGAVAIVLETDDRLYRKQQGERAAFGMYGKLGYAVLKERKMTDGTGWLMVIDADVFTRCQRLKAARHGEHAGAMSAETVRAQEALLANIRRRYEDRAGPVAIASIGAGDLAGLFLLLNLCPQGDFGLKLGSWGVVQGSELERAYVVNIRPALIDRERLEDASLVLRDAAGGILAVCATRRVLPFNRHTIDMDFYCLPQFLETNRDLVRRLVEKTISGIQNAPERPRPCRLSHTGIDAEKLRLFSELGFTPGGNVHACHGQNGEAAVLLHEYEKYLA